jgi:hypothetical protein
MSAGGQGEAGKLVVAYGKPPRGLDDCRCVFLSFWIANVAELAGGRPRFGRSTVTDRHPRRRHWHHDAPGAAMFTDCTATLQSAKAITWRRQPDDETLGVVGMSDVDRACVSGHCPTRANTTARSARSVPLNRLPFPTPSLAARMCQVPSSSKVRGCSAKLIAATRMSPAVLRS